MFIIFHFDNLGIGTNTKIRLSHTKYHRIQKREGNYISKLFILLDILLYSSLVATLNILTWFTIEDEEDFKLVGNGACLSRCDVDGSLCYINNFYTFPSNFDECKLACEKESFCTGFTITDSTYRFPNECNVYGDISSLNVALWDNPNDWTAYPIPTYGSEGFDVYSSTGESGAQCYKRQQSPYNGEFFSRCDLL